MHLKYAICLCVIGCLWILDPAGRARGQAPASSPAALGEDRQLVEGPDERVTILSNGLTVILKVHRTAPVVSARMYCRTGSLYEQEYLGSGMSHLFEHLLHGTATPTRTEPESRRLIDDIGGNTNAYTSFDVTCYYIDTAREHMETAVGLLAGWLTQAIFPQEAFDREWGVVQRELERDVDNPDRQLWNLTMETMYREHPARYPIIGYQPVVQSLTKEDIVGYYQRMYVPDNIVVCIAGDIDLDEALEVVKQAFASSKRQRAPMITLPEVPPMPTPRFATKQMKLQTAILRLAWPSIAVTHPDLYALDVLSHILTNGDSSRLARTIRDVGLVFTIDSHSWTPAWGKGMFVVTARLSGDRLEEAKAAILAQAEAVRADLVTTEELEQAKRQKAAEHVFASQTADRVAERMAQDYLSTGDVHFSQAYVEGIQQVTAEQIREVARRYLVPQHLATIAVLPEGQQVTPRPTSAAGEVQAIRKITLSNGLRCLIRPDPTTPLVAMQAFSLGGVLFENEQSNGLSLLAAMLAPRGTPTRDAQEIARFFDGRGGVIDGAAGNNTIYFSAQVLKADFEAALEVFSDVVCRPTFPTAELEIYRPQLLDQIRRIDEQWRSELMAYLQQRMFVNSPYRLQTAGSAAVIGNATREDVATFYKQQLTAPNTVVAVFGDVDADRAEELVTRYFGQLPDSPYPLPQVAPEPPRTEPRLFIKQKPPTRNVAGLGLGFAGMKVTDFDDVAETAVLDTIISGYRYPTGWLQESLRGGDRDLVYEVHAMNRPGLLPGAFQIYAACQPGRVNEVYKIIMEQLDRARAGDFTEEELARAKTIIETTDLMATQTNSERAMQAALDELYGLGYDQHEHFIEHIRAVALDDVKRMAQRYLVSPVITVVTPAPEQVELGMSPQAVDRDQAAGPAAGEDGS